MPAPDSPEQAQLISSARARAQALVRAFVDATNDWESVDSSCERASLAVEEYCDDLLKHLISANPPTTASASAWLKARYLTLMVEFGSAIRDAIRDSETRHAAAQGIQYRVLEHERDLRIALESAALAYSPAVEIKRDTHPGTPTSPQKPYHSQTDVSPETV